MKKFIAFFSISAVVISLSSCREVEEISELSQPNDSNIIISTNSGSPYSKTDSTNAKTLDEIQDPPKKDEIRW